MSFGGVLGMIKTLKDNRSLLKSRRDSFKSNYVDGIYAKEKGESLTFKEVSQQELIRIKAKNRKRIKKEESRLIWIVSCTAILLIVLLIYHLK